jgi:hypothetical protein
MTSPKRKMLYLPYKASVTFSSFFTKYICLYMVDNVCENHVSHHKNDFLIYFKIINDFLIYF